jgi:hypothetical protein
MIVYDSRFNHVRNPVANAELPGIPGLAPAPVRKAFPCEPGVAAA